MALQRYVLTATVTVPAGTAATVTAGEPGTGAPAGPGNAAVTPATWTYFPQVFLAGTAIVLDPAGPLYALIGAGTWRPGRTARRTSAMPRYQTRPAGRSPHRTRGAASRSGR